MWLAAHLHYRPDPKGGCVELKNRGGWCVGYGWTRRRVNWTVVVVVVVVVGEKIASLVDIGQFVVVVVVVVDKVVVVVVVVVGEIIEEGGKIVSLVDIGQFVVVVGTVVDGVVVVVGRVVVDVVVGRVVAGWRQPCSNSIHIVHKGLAENKGLGLV